ncbi:MAG: NAD(P)H-quinone oxidoreductase [Hyphomicrobiales bacterium]|nr:NAD(P)H-quinone oxidoreductase [Hyphomicrobiales bacterium]
MTQIPATMRQVIFDGAGGPEVIKLVDAATPQVAPGKALIEVAAFGVNRPDCLQRRGAYPPPPGETAVPGLEIAGRVVAVGPGVDTPKVGDEVCALVGSGGYAEYALADAALCLPRPRALDLVAAAGVPETYFTVYDNVFVRGRLTKGETFLVHGGSSGIGSTAIQLAKSAGAQVIATAGSAEKCDFCRSLGADLAIDYRRHDFVEETLKFTNKRGVDVILDMVGGPYIPKNVALLATDGRLVQIAFLQGAMVKEINWLPVMTKRLTLTGSTLRPRTLAQKTEVANALRANVWPLLDAGAVKPLIHAVFPMNETRQAHELMETSAHLGKIVVTTGR